MPTSDKKKLKEIKGKDAEKLLVECYVPGTEQRRDITDEILTFEARVSSSDDVLISKSSANPEQIEKTNAENGEAIIYIYRADTLQFEKGTTLKCQLISTDTLGRDNTIKFDLPLVYRS